jgi:GntR family transcriptional repressor for pyruvate dehydrogenase complex
MVTVTDALSSSDQPTAAGQVADLMARLILSEMTPGNSLPSEADLATRFAVSRLTVREAVKLLEGRGLVTLQRGRRAVVREPDGSAFADFLTSIIRSDTKGLFDLVEVRLSLEQQSAGLAAKRASRAAIAAIESALQGMRETAIPAGPEMTPEQEAAFHGYDVGFHEAIALASGNRVLGYLFEAMVAPLKEGFYISRRGHEHRGHTIQDTIAAHQRILDSIKEGNSRAAAEAMRVHLKDTERDIRAALTQLALRPGTGE